MALMEEFTPGRGENLHDYLIPTIGDVPPIRSILVEDPAREGPYLLINQIQYKGEYVLTSYHKSKFDYSKS